MHVVIPSVSLAAIPQGTDLTVRVETPSGPTTFKPGPVSICGNETELEAADLAAGAGELAGLVETADAAGLAGTDGAMPSPSPLPGAYTYAPASMGGTRAAPVISVAGALAVVPAPMAGEAAFR